jgi:hypothetical protein
MTDTVTCISNNHSESRILKEHVSPGIKPSIHKNGQGLNKREMTALPSSLDRPAIELDRTGCSDG